MPPTAKCTAAKIKCATTKATALLGCHNKAEGKNVPVDPACVGKAELKFSDPGTGKGCMEKAESKPPCATNGDAATIESKVDGFVLDVVTELDPDYPVPVLNKCSAGKKKCVANKVKALLGCYNKNATKPDQAKFDECIAKAQAKFDGGADPTKGCFAKLEAKPPCLTTGDTAALEAKADAFAMDVNTALGPPGPESVLLDFTLSASGGTCGDARDGSAVVVKTLTCGGLNIGGGGSIVPEGPTPDGSTYRYLLTCNGSSCTIGPTSTMPPVNSSDPDCSNTGCNFGAPLPIPNPAIPGITTCVMNTWKAPASGTLDLSTGSSSQEVPLNSDIYLTGNVAQPCPRCATGMCDRGPRAGLACTTTSGLGVSRDCPTGGTAPTGCGPMGTDPCPCTPGGGQCIDGSHVGVITVNLSPLTTGTATATNATGSFCPGQAGAPSTHAGCFGQNSCRTITENGTPYGAIMLGVPAPATLASVFCIDATMNGLVDASADLPGPGAIALHGVFLAHQ